MFWIAHLNKIRPVYLVIEEADRTVKNWRSASTISKNRNRTAIWLKKENCFVFYYLQVASALFFKVKFSCKVKSCLVTAICQIWIQTVYTAQIMQSSIASNVLILLISRMIKTTLNIIFLQAVNWLDEFKKKPTKFGFC